MPLLMTIQIIGRLRRHAHSITIENTDENILAALYLA